MHQRSSKHNFREGKVMRKKINRPTGMLKKMLCVLTVACMVTVGAPQAAFAANEQPAEIPDSYAVDGMNYFKVNTDKFAESDYVFFEKMLSSRNKCLGDRTNSIIDLGLKYNTAEHWDNIGRAIWKSKDSHPAKDFVVPYMQEAIRGFYSSEDDPTYFYGLTSLESATSMKQAEHDMLKLVSEENTDNRYATFYPAMAKLLNYSSRYQNDTKSGPVFYFCYYAGVNFMTPNPVGLMAVVFSDFKVDPLIPEDKDGNYVSTTVNDVTTNQGAYASDARNNTALTAVISQNLTMTQSASVTSEVNGSSNYSYGNTITVGTEPQIPLVGSIKFENSFTMSKEIQNGWSNSKARSEELSTGHEVSVELPPYTGVMLKQTEKTKEMVTSYNCPVSISYRVRVLDYGYYDKKGEANVIADFTQNSQANLKKRAVSNAGYADTEGLDWNKIKGIDNANKSIQAMAGNTPMASTNASFTEKLSTVESVVDRLMPLLPLKIVQLKGQSDEITMRQGDTLRVDTIALEGLNANKCRYYGFDKDYGKWTVSDGSVASLTKNSNTGKLTLTAKAPGKVYLKYLINENRYNTLGNPKVYATNASLTKPAVIEITVKKKDPANRGKPGVSNKTADKTITNMNSEKDPSGSEFKKLMLKSPKQTKKAITLKWTKVSKAKKYVVYANKCGKTNKPKKLATVTGTSKTFSKVAGKKIKKGTYYKFIVVALDKNSDVVSTSKLIHVATKGGKIGDHKSVTIKKAVIKKARNLRKGSSLKLGAKMVPRSKKLKVQKHVGVRYESTNTNVATVSSKGVVKAKHNGKCYVYAFAENGIYKKVTVIVK